ncbi:MAG: hypothetical protein LKI88_00170 [Bifidobacterium sp.]|jgi:hypothetical protein|nr:hypothetical protein [Bifidobacterium sp.]MCI1864350.1 hypothetical protein [Bifidobacterium sp.]
MSKQVEHHSEISVTRRIGAGLDRTDIQVTHMSVTRFGADDPADDDEEPQGFDPDSCCDDVEKALIASLRAYLRPQVAPRCLFTRLEATLDKCCLREERGMESPWPGRADV